MAVGRPLFERVGGFVELASVIAPEEDREELFTTVGANYAVNPSFVLDAAVLVGLSRDADDFQILFGFTKNFGRVRSWFQRDRDPAEPSPGQ